MVLVDRFGYFWAELAFIQFPVWTESFTVRGLADMRISQALADVCVNVKLAALALQSASLFIEWRRVRTDPVNLVYDGGSRGTSSWAASGYWEELKARLAALLESSSAMHSWSHGLMYERGERGQSRGNL